MKRALILLSAILTVAAAMRAELFYLQPDGDRTPRGRITAVEARAAVADGKIGSTRKASWAICWSGVKVAMEFDFGNYLDGIDEPKVKVSCNGRSAVIGKGINCAGGFNTLAVEWADDGTATVLAGERSLKPMMTFDSLPQPSDSIRLSGTKLTADCLIAETDDRDFSRLMTAHTPTELEAATRWRYLDRDNDPKLAVAGGAYELAQIGNELIYMSGAVTNSHKWTPGMLKGRLTPTGYDGYFRLEWVDATGRTLNDESYATFDSATKTMKLTFPGLHTSLRFTSHTLSDRIR